MALVGLYGLLVRRFGLGSVASTEPRLLGTAAVQQAWRSESAELGARLVVMELLVAGRCGLATTHLDSLAPSIEDPGMNPAEFSCFALVYDDLRQPIPIPGMVAIGTAVANSSRCALPKQAPRPVGDFSCILCFGARGEEDILGNLWVHLWVQQSRRQYCAQSVWTLDFLAREAMRSDVHTRAQILFGYFVSH